MINRSAAFVVLISAVWHSACCGPWALSVAASLEKEKWTQRFQLSDKTDHVSSLLKLKPSVWRLHQWKPFVIWDNMNMAEVTAVRLIIFFNYFSFFINLLFISVSSCLHLTIRENTILQDSCNISLGRQSTENNDFSPAAFPEMNNHPTSWWPHFISLPKAICIPVLGACWPENSVPYMWISPGRNIKANTWNTETPASKTACGNSQWGHEVYKNGE